LGPYLFASFIGALSLPSTDSEEIFKYADDITLTEKVKKNSDLNEMEFNTDKIVQWINYNGLKENEKKRSRLMIFTKTSTSSLLSSPVTNTLKILGVTWEKSLNWNIHINEMLRKAASRMYAVRLLLPLLGKDKTLLVYDSIVSSILSYAAPLLIGMNASTLYKVERLQKRHHKLICGEGCQCTVFQSILKSSAVKLFLQAASNTNHPLHDRIPPRLSTGRFRQPLAKTTRRLRSFVPFTSTLVNSAFKRC